MWFTTSSEQNEDLHEPRPPASQISPRKPFAIMRCGFRKRSPMSSAKSRTNCGRSSGSSSGSHAIRRSLASASAFTAGAISLSASVPPCTAATPLRSSMAWALTISARVTTAAAAAAFCSSLSLPATFRLASSSQARLSTVSGFHFWLPGNARR